MNAAISTWPNLVAMFFAQAEALGDKPFLWMKRDGAYSPLTWRQTADQVVRLSRGLAALGVVAGDRVVLVSENRPEWLISEVAIMATGAIAVPAYTTNTEADHLHIVTNSGAKGAIVSSRRLAAKLVPAAHRSPEMQFVIAIEPPEITQSLTVDIHAWDSVLAGGETGADVAAAAAAMKRTDTAAIIYTSGTGGAPKGVMLHHGAILHNCEGAREAVDEIGLGNEAFLSFLPLSHSYEHACGQFLPIFLGAEIYYAEGAESLIKNLGEARPTLMISVPRLYDVISSRILADVRKVGGFREKMFNKAVALGRKRHLNGGQMTWGERFQDILLDKLVRNKVRGRFGGRLKAMVSGGAPLNPEIGIFFKALGLPIIQGYGQTESAPVVSINRPTRPKMHTVGPPLANTEVRIAEDGEILVRGELVMQGYWRDPDLTARTIKDGWLHTGDVGVIDDDGHLLITDRKKDIIVNSGGDNIAPQRVEGMLTLEPEIAQAMVYGDRRPHLVGVLVADAEWSRAWAAENGREYDPKALAGDRVFSGAMMAAVDRVNRNLSTIEKVRRVIVAPEPFSIDNGQITPTLKLRRHKIVEAYGDALDALYG
ncbi:MAG: AMP-dependent synthetase/ligase [Rhodospirillales bacterium]|jgi:long-chain acyl-CoA synthetase|nr:AMP-dependent synthetase/ligase [Rhodospirillales bacterium]